MMQPSEMNRIFRRRLPPSVRNLLTDIGPKEEEYCTGLTDTESESVCRDGIVIPSRKSDSHEEFLKPAGAQSRCSDVPAKDGSGTDPGTVCGLCKSERSCYTCPRCNMPYCCLACYRSPDHIVCSEDFYKESVLLELKDMGETGAEGRKKMQNILLGLKQKSDRAEGGMEGVLREVGIGIEDSQEGAGEAQALMLLSRLAELQQSGEGSATEIEDIFRMLKVIGGKDDADRERLTGAGVGDIDDAVEDGEGEEEEEEQDLADRLSGLDIDSLSEEALWELLNSQEKEGFMDFLKGKRLGGLVPLWKPWWEVHEEDGSAMVEVLEEDICKKDSERSGPRHVKTKSASKRNKQVKEISKGEGSVSAASTVPPISAKIPKLSSLSASPSPLVCYGLVNALFGYTFTLCLFNGDIDSLTQEFCDMILAVSESLNSNRVFGALEQALECGEAACLAGGHVDRQDPHASNRAVEAVAHVMTGNSRKDPTGYCLAALSHIRTALSKARAALPKGSHDEERRKLFLAGKKCEFYQAWVSDNADHIRTSAVGLWHEHSKRMSQRTTLEKEKRAVEEGWKKGKRMGNRGKLIEELN